MLCDEQLDKLVLVTLNQDPDSPGLILTKSEDTSGSQNSKRFPLRGDSNTVAFSPWLLDLVNSSPNSAGTKRSGEEEEETALDIILPPRLEQLNLNLHLPYSLHSLRLSSSTLQRLSIPQVARLQLDLPRLRRMQFWDWVQPLDDTLAAQLDALTSLSFCFSRTQQPSVAVVESHLETASRLQRLATLEFSCPDHKEKIPLGSVRIRQQDFPSVKTFMWAIPFTFQFHPEDKFTEVISSKVFYPAFRFEFLNNEHGYQYRFDVLRLDRTWSVEVPQGGMAQLSHLYLPSVPCWFHDWCKFCLQLIRPLTEVKHIRIRLIEPVEGRHYWPSGEVMDWTATDEFMEWLSSLTSLTTLEGYMSQSRLDQFLRQTRTAGPLQIAIWEVLREDPAHLDEGLHRTVHDMMRRRVLSKFVHPTKCACQADCLIKGHCLP